MKQLLQNLATGETEIAEVPEPIVGNSEISIRTTRTLISSGTEKMLIDFGKANLIDKARQQPDKVKQVFEKIKTDGLAPTLRAVQNKLAQPLATGYCNVGVVGELGGLVDGFQIGDRVVSNGKHAGVVCVPKNLCAKIPQNVTDEQAVFTVVGAIGLQGIRLVEPTLGECVVVIGLGLIGLLTVQLLKANGCRVLGVDFDAQKIQVAQSIGAETVNLANSEDLYAAAERFSRARGVDAVIITASTSSNDPVHQAAKICRKRGRIVLVGVVGLELSRADFYEKELSFQVSCSYGPGRYDSDYEEKGIDYPVGYIRWTEQRNFEAFLDLLASGAIDVDPLISHRFSIEQAPDAYDLITGKEPSLGVVLEFSPNEVASRSVQSASQSNRRKLESMRNPPSKVSVGFIGAGNYATQILIPAFAETSAHLHTVLSAGGVSAVHAAKRLGISNASTDMEIALGDPTINTIVVSTRHNSHASICIDALHAGKHVFVEKPLILSARELELLIEAYDSNDYNGLLMVGFNRRFAPQIVELKQLLKKTSQPKTFIYTINAGSIPTDHWTQDPEIGGGRIIGEACHFIDLLRHLAGANIESLNVSKTQELDGNKTPSDIATIAMTFADGSHGTVHYFSNGNKAFPKERLEVFCGGGIIQLDNFRKMRGYGWPGFKKMNLFKQDKGNAACVAAFVEAIDSGNMSPIPFEELVEVHERTLEAAKLLA